MSARKRILVVVSFLIILVTISTSTKANHHWNLLEGYDPYPSQFKELEIGDKIVYWHQRTMGEAIVELDYIVYQFDKKRKELVDVRMCWREDLPAFLPKLNITQKQAESMVEGRVKFSKLFIISPESDIFPIKPMTKNPCWVVASVVQDKGTVITVVDAVEAKVLGYGVPPPQPYTAFSLSGPQYQNPCEKDWYDYYLNPPYGAKFWFDTMGYSTEDVNWPSEEKVKSHIQSDTTAMFYELAHGAYWGFASGCDANCYEMTWASEIDDWISDYTKMPFTFLGSCDGMCDTNVGTLSYAFRMGSTRDTATVGYCEMDTEKCLFSQQQESCWSFALRWQKRLFECMNNGSTVKEAFDLANADYPACFNPEEQRECMRFAGDPNLRVVPVVPRVPPFPSLSKVDDVNDANCIYPWNMIEENYLNYTICYDANGHAANNVTIVDQLPADVNYYSSDSNGVYDSNSHTVTWDINDLSATDSGSVHLTVKVKESAKPGGSFRNYCEIRNDQYSRNATEKTNVCCWGPDIIYVDANAGGFNNGTSWQDAYTDLQDALAGASNCDSKNVIKVAAGTYNPTRHIWYPHARFQLINGVAVYGGYPPGGGQRNPVLYEAILSGDIDGNSTPDIDYVVRSADNAILDGFTITMGRTGIYSEDCNSLMISNCIISDNISDANGGGLYCEDSNNVTITDCIITRNSVARGGGLYNESSDLNITNCIFSNNSSYEGGAVYNAYSDSNVTNCIFADNFADDYGGGMYNYQAAPEISNCTFSGNQATSGGGISNSGPSPNITKCTFSDNSANYGGAVFNYSSDPNITNCIFSGNTATSAYGGGIYNMFESNPTIINCIFSGNTSISWDGGGMYNYQSSPTLINCTFRRNSAGRFGGGMFNCDDSDPNVTNCIFWSNTPSEIVGGSPVITFSDIQGAEEVNGNIDEDPCFFSVEPSTGNWTESASYDNSTFQSTLYDSGADWSVNGLAGKFVNPDTLNQDLQFFIVSNDVNTIKVWGNVTNIAGDGDPYQIYDYHLRLESACIDAGDPDFNPDPNAKDIDGEPRIFDGDSNGSEIVDMGADEYYWSPADFNSDGIVNFFDYAFFASAWQSEPNDDNYNEDCDLEDDNLIDYKDIALFCEDWLWQTAWAKAFPSAYDEGLGRSMGMGMDENFSFTEGLYSSKQAQPELTAADFEEILKWLEDLWLTNEEVRKIISEEEWLKFIESVIQAAKEQIYN
jgi:parallel beta-helix repeat protein